jgi:hypothetical protein
MSSQSGKSTHASKSASIENETNESGIQRSTRLSIQGVMFETTTTGETRLTVSKPIDGTLTEDDIENALTFFGSLVREQRRQAGPGGGSQDGRGQVLTPGDGRLKENR